MRLVLPFRKFKTVLIKKINIDMTDIITENLKSRLMK